jgi:hypothetical protein
MKMFKKMIVVAAMALLAICAQVGTASAALVNGGFETGDFTGWSIDSVSNWALVMDSGSKEGTYHAELGTYGSVGTLSQTFSTTAGQAYSVKYWLANDLSGDNSFQALWNNSAIQATALTNVNAFGYREYLFTATANSDSSTIAFNFLNEPSVFHLDNVDVTPTPIPAAFWMLGSGLLGLAGVRRKQK